MKYAIFGDIHGKDLSKLEEKLSIENPDSIICLGDFDQVKTIRQFIEIEKDYLKKGKEIIKVPGNHDYAILKNQPIISNTLRVQGKSSHKLHQELIRDKEAYSYLNDLVHSDFSVKGFLDKKKFNKEYSFVVIHGAHIGNLTGFFGYPREIRPLWNRLLSEEDFILNFNEMKKRNEKIMIRGHDHFPTYTSKNGKQEETIFTTKNQKYELSKENLHVINPGAFFYGDLAIIDTLEKEPVIEYKKIL